MNAKIQDKLWQLVSRYGHLHLSPLPHMKTLWADLDQAEARKEHDRLLNAFLLPLIETSTEIFLYEGLGSGNNVDLDVLQVFERRGKGCFRLLVTGDNYKVLTPELLECFMTGRKARGGMLVVSYQPIETFKRFFKELYDPAVVTNLSVYSGTAPLIRARRLVANNPKAIVIGIFGGGFRSITVFAAKTLLYELFLVACQNCFLSLNAYYADPT